MGSCFSSTAAATEVPSSTAQGSSSTQKAPSSTNNRGQLQNNNDSPPGVVAEESTTTRVPRNDSIYFDAVMTEEEMEKFADELFEESHEAQCESYAPARTRNPYTRSSIFMADPKTLLLEQEKKKSRRETVMIREGLTAPTKRLQLEGYPGDLTPSELENCLQFRSELKSRPLYYDMVHAWDGVEEEPFALCRFLRARKFDPQEVLVMMEETMPRFEKAHAEKFYPDIDQALGCPSSVLLSQYPYYYYGSAMNGCPIAYFRAGRVSVEGIDCCTDLDTKLVRYLWHGLKYIFPATVSKMPPDSRRCELFFVVDLAGLTTSMLNSRTIGLFKKLSEATSSFPEVLNKTVVVNAPAYFSFSWRIMKGFLHPRTAAKIEIYRDSAQKRLLELIDKNELLSDYGGNSTSFEKISQPQGVLRQVNKLVSFSASGMSIAVDAGVLTSEEQMNVSVFSRSTFGAEVTVVRDGGTLVAERIVVRPPDADAPHYCVNIANHIKGPGKFAVNVKTRQTSKSYEYFLVVVDVVASSSTVTEQ